MEQNQPKDILKIFSRYCFNSGDMGEEKFSKLLILIVSISCSVCGLFWGILYYFLLGSGIVMFLPWLFVLIVGLSIPISHFFKNHFILIYAQIICITWIPALVQWCLGSVQDSGMVVFWSFLGPFGALLFLNKKQSIIWVIQFLFIVGVSILIEPRLSNDGVNVTNNFRQIFYLMNLCAPGIVVFCTSFYFVTNLMKQKKMSDDLLLNILPKKTADELKQKGFVDTKYFDEVTVMFTDFKNFTKMSENLTPAELVGEIHNCYSEFDKIIEKNKLEKIKTIGDSYMCVGGLPILNEYNAECIVKAALEISEFINQQKQKRINEGKPYFEIRIGCHTGPVIAGVVGEKKFAYDIWGDTVNIASRLEGLNKDYGTTVIISDSVYKNLIEKSETKYHCRLLDKVQVKGKQNSTGVYELYESDFPNSLEKKNETKDNFEEAVAYYLNGEFELAARKTLSVLNLNPTDLTAVRLLQRSAENFVAGGNEILKSKEDILVKWSDEYSVGISGVDEQHKQLFEIINDSYWAKSKGLGRQYISKILNRLVIYTVAHFSVEEEFMLRHNYVGYIHHKNSHEKFKEKVGVFLVDLNAGNAELTNEILHYLFDWLKHHIGKEDKEMGTSIGMEL